MSESQEVTRLRNDASGLHKALRARGISLKLSDVQEAMAAAGGLRHWNVLVAQARKLPGTLPDDSGNTQSKRTVFSAKRVPTPSNNQAASVLHVKFSDLDGNTARMDVFVDSLAVSFGVPVFYQVNSQGGSTDLLPRDSIEWKNLQAKITRVDILPGKRVPGRQGIDIGLFDDRWNDAISLSGNRWNQLERDGMDSFMILAALSWSATSAAAQLIQASLPEGRRIPVWRRSISLLKTSEKTQDVGAEPGVVYTEQSYNDPWNMPASSVWLMNDGAVRVGGTPATFLDTAKFAELRSMRAFFDEVARHVRNASS